MDRKAIARETVKIMEQGYYETKGCKVEIGKQQEKAVSGSFLLTPEEGGKVLEEHGNNVGGNGLGGACISMTKNCSTVDALLALAGEGKREIGILNFASAKNPGGGFLNGAMAQEESIAVSSCLYKTLLAHEKYYAENRACGTMMYTDYAIYSPDVVFFRDGKFGLLQVPVTASVLTLPAVNMGQVMLKREDARQAERVMEHRMALALAVFAKQGCRHLILGAYGCGVFRNDPEKVAEWWKQLLTGAFAGTFESVVHAVLDRSVFQGCYKAFQKRFPDNVKSSTVTL